MNSKEKVQIHRGMDKVKKMQFDDALQIFDHLLELNPEIPEAWNNKGVALHRLGRAEEALECYERSLTIDPENMDALRNKGFVLRYLGRLEEALQAYDSVLQKGGEPLDMESTASVLATMGRLEEALECMLLAREAAPIERFEEEIEVLKSMIMQRDGIEMPEEN
jgi:tetratricopeptide (TPR) repeat protein